MWCSQPCAEPLVGGLWRDQCVTIPKPGLFSGPLSSTLRTTCCEAFRTRISPSVFSCGCSAATWAEPEERECLCEQKMIHAHDTICLWVKHFCKWCNATIEHGFSQDTPQLNQVNSRRLFSPFCTFPRVLESFSCLLVWIWGYWQHAWPWEGQKPSVLLNNFTSAADRRAALLSEVHLNAETLQLQLGSYPLWKPLDEMGGLSQEVGPTDLSS